MTATNCAVIVWLLCGNSAVRVGKMNCSRNIRKIHLKVNFYSFFLYLCIFFCTFAAKYAPMATKTT